MKDVMAVVVFVLAVGSIFQRRPIRGVLMRMGLSTGAVALYVVLSAPDVALAEAMVGALLTTFVYVLLLRTPGTLRVGYVPTPLLFEEYLHGYEGIEYEVVKDFAAKYGYRIEFIRFESADDLEKSFEEGYVDVACGPFVSKESGILETVVLSTEDGKEVDFLSASGMSDTKFIRKEKAFYTILSDDEDFLDFLREIGESGILDDIVRKYAGERT